MNKIICLNCKTELESKSVHDFVECSCSNETFVDGGDEYHRIGGQELALIAYWNVRKNRYEYLTTNKKVNKEDLMPIDMNTENIKTNTYIGSKVKKGNLVKKGNVNVKKVNTPIKKKK